MLLASVRDALAFSRRSALAQAERQTVQRRLARLTAREREVRWLVVRGGLTNRQIAAELGAAEKTIKVHRGQVTRKMQADSVAALVHMIQRLDVNQFRSVSGDDAAAAMNDLDQGAVGVIAVAPSRHETKVGWAGSALANARPA